MSAPDDPFSPPDEPRVPPPMSIFAAAGWVFATLFIWVLLLSLILVVRPGVADDLTTEIGCQAIAYLLGLFLILRVHAPDASIRELLGVRATHPAFFPLAILLGLAVQIPANAIYDLVVRYFPGGHEGTLGAMIREGSTLKRVQIGLIVVGVGPAIEELFFRGAIFRPALRTNTPRVVIAVTAILFAITHQEPRVFLPIGLFGVCLGVVRRASGSLFPSMVLHATFNAVTFYAMVTSRADDTDTPLPGWLVAAGCAATLALLAGVNLLGARSAVATRARERDLA